MNPKSEQQRIAFGYNRGPANQIVLNVGQEAAVKLIFQLYLAGQSIGKTKGFLEGARIPSPQNKPSWGKQTIANILSNPHYVGDDVYPAIIETQQYQAAQEKKAAG